MSGQQSGGIVSDTVNAASKYAASAGDTVKKMAGAGEQEEGKQQAKHDDSVGGKVEGGKKYVEGAFDKNKHGAQADAEKNQGSALNPMSSNNPLKDN